MPLKKYFLNWLFSWYIWSFTKNIVKLCLTLWKQTRNGSLILQLVLFAFKLCVFYLLCLFHVYKIIFFLIILLNFALNQKCFALYVCVMWFKTSTIPCPFPVNTVIWLLFYACFIECCDLKVFLYYQIKFYNLRGLYVSCHLILLHTLKLTYTKWYEK